MKHVHDHIPAYLDGRLDETDRLAVAAHCEACPDCARALSESEAVWRMMGDVPAPAPSESLWSRVAEALPSQRQPVWARLGYATVSAAALAAGVLIGVGQYGAEKTADWRVMNEVLTGSLLADDSTWSLDYALDYALSSDEDIEGE
jgi:anti-sigma factor RsiW